MILVLVLSVLPNMVKSGEAVVTPLPSNCMSKLFSINEVLTVHGKELRINVTVLQEYVGKGVLNVTLVLEMIGDVRINYTRPLMDFAVVTDAGVLKWWSSGRYFMQVVESITPPIKRKYSMMVNGTCLKLIIIDIRSLGYFRVIALDFLHLIPLSAKVESLREYGIKASPTPSPKPLPPKVVVTPSKTTKAPSETTSSPIRLRTKEVGVSAKTRTEVITLVKTLTVTKTFKKVVKVSENLTHTTQPKVKAFITKIPALVLALGVALATSILAYILILRLRY